MRLLIELEAATDCAYDLRYHHKLQGLMYGLLKGSAYQDLHNKPTYKFFCFSNIFPSTDMQNGEQRNLLISSPDNQLIQVFKDRLSFLRKAKKQVHIGEMNFILKSISLLNPRVRGLCTLTTGTPIIIRIPRINYFKYGIKPPRDYPYVYWRSHYPFNAFLRQLEDNLIKKYNEFYSVSVQYFPLFEEAIFRKQVCNHMIIKESKIRVFGTLWQFKFRYLSEKKSRIVQFGLDSGFGEMNSLGFGLMNIEEG